MELLCQRMFFFIVFYCTCLQHFSTQGHALPALKPKTPTDDNSSCAHIPSENTDASVHTGATFCKYPNLWSIEEKKCAFFKEVNCGNRSEPISPCEYLNSNCTKPFGKDVALCTCETYADVNFELCLDKSDKNVVWPNRKWTPFYIQCLTRRTIPRNCPDYKIFNFIDGKCDDRMTFVRQAYNLSMDIPPDMRYLINFNPTTSGSSQQSSDSISLKDWTTISTILTYQHTTQLGEQPISNNQNNVPASTNTDDTLTNTVIHKSSDVFQPFKSTAVFSEATTQQTSLDSTSAFDKIRKYVHADDTTISRKRFLPHGNNHNTQNLSKLVPSTQVGTTFISTTSTVDLPIGISTPIYKTSSESLLETNISPQISPSKVSMLLSSSINELAHSETSPTIPSSSTYTFSQLQSSLSSTYSEMNFISTSHEKIIEPESAPWHSTFQHKSLTQSRGKTILPHSLDASLSFSSPKIFTKFPSTKYPDSEPISSVLPTLNRVKRSIIQRSTSAFISHVSAVSTKILNSTPAFISNSSMISSSSSARDEGFISTASPTELPFSTQPSLVSPMFTLNITEHSTLSSETLQEPITVRPSSSLADIPSPSLSYTYTSSVSPPSLSDSLKPLKSLASSSSIDLSAKSIAGSVVTTAAPQSMSTPSFQSSVDVASVSTSPMSISNVPSLLSASTTTATLPPTSSTFSTVASSSPQVLSSTDMSVSYLHPSLLPFSLPTLSPSLSLSMTTQSSLSTSLAPPDVHASSLVISEPCLTSESSSVALKSSSCSTSLSSSSFSNALSSLDESSVIYTTSLLTSIELSSSPALALSPSHSYAALQLSSADISKSSQSVATESSTSATLSSSSSSSSSSTMASSLYQTTTQSFSSLLSYDIKTLLPSSSLSASSSVKSSSMANIAPLSSYQTTPLSLAIKQSSFTSVLSTLSAPILTTEPVSSSLTLSLSDVLDSSYNTVLTPSLVLSSSSSSSPSPTSSSHSLLSPLPSSTTLPTSSPPASSSSSLLLSSSLSPSLYTSSQSPSTSSTTSTASPSTLSLSKYITSSVAPTPSYYTTSKSDLLMSSFSTSLSSSTILQSSSAAAASSTLSSPSQSSPSPSVSSSSLLLSLSSSLPSYSHQLSSSAASASSSSTTTSTTILSSSSSSLTQSLSSSKATTIVLSSSLSSLSQPILSPTPTLSSFKLTDSVSSLTSPSLVTSMSPSISPSPAISSVSSEIQSEASTSLTPSSTYIVSSSISNGNFDKISGDNTGSNTSLIVGLSVGFTVILLGIIITTIIVLRNRMQKDKLSAVRLPPELYISDLNL